MQREWKDPRDGTEWLVTLSPFGSRSAEGLAAGKRLTISFHRPGRRPCWTPYPLRRPASQAGDQELMDLLDAARGNGATRARTSGRPGARRASARTRTPGSSGAGRVRR